MNISLATVCAKFPSEQDCIDHLELVRWESQPKCPHCESERHSRMEKEARYHCNKCNLSYSVTVKTIFHNTRVDLRKWFLMITVMINARPKPSTRNLAKIIGVNKNTACYMAMRLRHSKREEREILLKIADFITE